MKIDKSKNDERVIKYFVLDNNIKCVSVYDKNIIRSYVSVCVNIGSLANKDYYEGIAHLLEHMCFITSKKYQEHDYLIKKTQEYGGNTNAYTSENNTVYYFNVFTKYLENIIEIFVDYLVNADLKKENILNELQNVNSEHEKNINNDGFKLFNLKHLLSDKNTNNHSFFTGSNKTLNKKDIHEKLVDFYKKYYVSNNFSICIVSNCDINEQKRIIKKHFGTIPYKKSNIVTINKPIFTKNKGKSFIMSTINKTYELHYIFETSNSKKYYQTKIFTILAYLINLNCKNSLKNNLISLIYIYSLYAYHDYYEGLFVIVVNFTKKGFSKIDFINYYIKTYVNQLLNVDFEEIYNILKKKSKFVFNNITKIDSEDLSSMISTNLFIYEPQYVITGGYLFFEYNNNHYNDLKEYINFDSCIQIKLTKIKLDKYKVDQHYGTQYAQIKRINDNFDYYFDFNNNFDFSNIYLKSKPKYIKNLNNIIPTQIKKNIWFGNLSKFNDPVYYLSIIFYDQTFFNTPINYILTNISLTLLNYYININLNKPLELNYDFEFEYDCYYNKIILHLSLLNDITYSQLFINDIINLIFNKITFNKDFIDLKIKQYKDNIDNIKNGSAWGFCNYILSLNYSNNYDYKVLLNNISKINSELVLNHLNNLFVSAKVKICIYGNIKQFDFSNKYLNLNQKFKEEHGSYKIVKNIIAKHPNKNEKNKSIKILYHICEYNPKLYVHLIILQLILNDYFFIELRTKQQLGYSVSLNYQFIDQNVYMTQQIESIYNVNILEDAINNFNNKIIDYIKSINLSNWITILVNDLKEKKTSIIGYYNIYLSEITSNKYMFNRNEILLKYVKYISLSSLIHFVDKYIIKNDKKIIVKVI